MSSLKNLLALFARLFKYFTDKQLIDAGRAKADAQQAKEVLNNVKDAQDAINRADDTIISKLRKRYNL